MAFLFFLSSLQGVCLGTSVSTLEFLGFSKWFEHSRFSMLLFLEHRRRFHWVVVCLTFQQHARGSRGRIRSDKCSCCHTDIEVAHQTFYLTQSQYTDTRPTSPRADCMMPGAWQGSHCCANFEVTGMTRSEKSLRPKRDSNPGSRPRRPCSEAGHVVRSSATEGQALWPP